MAEEQRCQEGHRLCANNCGFFGSPATLDLCSKCYCDLRLKEKHASSAKIAVEKSLLSPPSAATSSPSSVISTEAPAVAAAAVRSPAVAAEAVTAEPAQQQANRCAGCKRKVGLTGFRCRCGSTFCGTHRYPEQHACTFDFKSAGREAIARANPVVKAAKLDKI